MANTLAAFMAQNVEKVAVKKVVISKRFKDGDGNPVEWELVPITNERNDELKEECTKLVQMTGKPGVMIPKLNNGAYVGKLAAECVTYPNLNNADLQDSYGATCSESLLKAMLLPGEYIKLTDAVSEVNGFNETMDDLVKEAKN